MNTEQLWQAVLGELELSISRAQFLTWFKNTYISQLEEDKVIIAVPNSFAKTWLENKYHPYILKALQNVAGQPIKEIIYQVETKPPSVSKTLSSSKKEVKTSSAPPKTFNNSYGLNSRYTFHNFVVGKTNELARAAALAVAEKPGLVYNPLFIYGGVGLGKTHLLHAIGNHIVEHFKDKKVLYVPCEKFTSEFINAISNGTTDKFKNTYRNVDVLLIDDIQFLAGKEGTQVEFFHTFNSLHTENKQIVISSDRPPKAISALEHRLLSRFEWGMIVDIQPPDLETRIAILESKCKEKGVTLASEILHYIASMIQQNIRELEGSLNKIIAFHQLKNTEITLKSVKELIAKTQSFRRGSLSPKQLIKTVAEFYDISIEDLIGKSRKKELVIPRQIAVYLMRAEIKSSFPSIGAELGGRDHTTAMHAYLKIAKEIEENEKLRQEINLIRQRLYSG